MRKNRRVRSRDILYEQGDGEGRGGKGREGREWVEKGREKKGRG